MLFDEEGFMTKPEKSELICVLEEKLESGDYSYHHQPGSAFLLLFAVLTKFTEMSDIYHTYGCCDYDTDVIIELLYYVPVFHKEGLKELWV